MFLSIFVIIPKILLLNSYTSTSWNRLKFGVQCFSANLTMLSLSPLKNFKINWFLVNNPTMQAVSLKRISQLLETNHSISFKCGPRLWSFAQIRRLAVSLQATEESCVRTHVHHHETTETKPGVFGRSPPAHVEIAKHRPQHENFAD